jgi:hypothetical protein
MLNFRVCDLDAMLAQLRAKGADVAEQTQDMEGVGSAGSPIPRATGSSCGSPPDRIITQAVTCLWPARYYQAAEVRPAALHPHARFQVTETVGVRPDAPAGRQAAAEISPTRPLRGWLADRLRPRDPGDVLSR